MDAGKELFDALRTFKEPDSTGRSPQTQLIDYCTHLLGSIERVHYDFKTKSDATDPKLSESDKKNLAKAISGFANTGGGVLIWGIIDETVLPKPVSEAPVFLNALLNLAHQATDPAVPGIDGDWIPSDSSTGRDGFPLVYVPESPLPPHRVALKIEGIQNHYFTRSGESFVVATHTQLEDMFGRRPRPKLQLARRVIANKPVHIEREVSLGFKIVLGIENIGRGVAKFPYLAVTLDQPYTNRQFGIAGDHNFGLPPLPTSVGSERKYGGSANIVIYPGIIHEVLAVNMAFVLPLYALKVPDLVIHYTLAAEGIRPVEGIETITGEELWAAAQAAP